MYALARRYEICTSTVSGLIRRHGVPARAQRTFTAADLEAASGLYQQSLSFGRGGDRLGFDTETIRKHLRRHGVPIPRPGGRTMSRAAQWIARSPSRSVPAPTGRCRRKLPRGLMPHGLLP